VLREAKGRRLAFLAPIRAVFSAMTFPADLSIPLGALILWMLALTAKHVLCDFFLQTPWMALGKDAATGWAKPLLVHCAIHGVVATLILLALAPPWWFLGLVDFAIHLSADRAKGFCVARFNLTSHDSWFWWLLGIDQAIHHLTDFGFAVLLAARAPIQLGLGW
jgi:hypothetical protein